jgi:hypothetical protein
MRASIVGTVLLFAAAGCSAGDDEQASPATIPQATAAELDAAGLAELQLAPAAKRVDLELPTFSNPTRITNPLFPISRLHSAILNGVVDEKRFRTETTLLPGARIIDWPAGHPTRTVVSQYTAYLDGRIEEVALDLYAQADDGSVWYFGEDVFNYEDGAVADTEGTWHAGVDGPAAMIMPAHPKRGDVYRPENVPGLVFEQVTVKPSRRVEGPRGPVEHAIVAEELHQDGGREDKIFAAGYGEFFTSGGGDVEALALAVPTDRVRRPMPEALRTLAAMADEALGHPKRVPVVRMAEAWRSLREMVPPRLRTPTKRAIELLSRTRSRQAAIDLQQAVLDLQLQYREPRDIDRARLALWARQLIVDASAESVGAVRGDLATLEWIRDRVAPALRRTDVIRLDVHLGELRGFLGDEDFDALAAEAARLRATLTNIGN